MKKTIEQIVEEHGLDIHKEGTVLRAFCPFHNDTGKPNFTVYPETDSWFCFACNEGGDVVSFISKIDQISRAEAQKRYEGAFVELEELQQKIDGVQIENDPVTFNTELNVVVSHHCKKYLQTHPEQAKDVLIYLKQFDNKLFVNISYDEMQKVLQEVKQKFPIV